MLYSNNDPRAVGAMFNEHYREDKEPEIYAYCDICDEPIYDGDKYYDINGIKYCEACINSCECMAECEGLW